MNTTGAESVLWVNVRSLVEAGDPYAAKNMEKWDEELLVACRRYPDMRVYDWASDVKDAWFIDDGIHFTSPGYATRGELIAHAGGGRLSRFRRKRRRRLPGRLTDSLFSTKTGTGSPPIPLQKGPPPR